MINGGVLICEATYIRYEANWTGRNKIKTKQKLIGWTNNHRHEFHEVKN